MNYCDIVKNAKLGETCGCARVTVHQNQALTDYGQQVKEDCQIKVKNKEIKGNFKLGSFIPKKSGARTLSGGLFAMNTWENLAFQALDGDHVITTSTVIMYSKEERWLLTQSGSLYTFDALTIEMD